MYRYSMKAILEFDLPTEKEDLQTAWRAAEYKAALFDIWQQTRSMLKHGNHENAKELVSTLETICEIAAEFVS